MPAKPSIVFAHGLWADGSCFSKVIPPLQAEGYQVIASQHSLDSLEGDVAGGDPHAGPGQQPGPARRPLLRRHRDHRRGHRRPGRRAGLHLGARPRRERDLPEPAGQVPRHRRLQHIEVADGRIWMRPRHEGLRGRPTRTGAEAGLGHPRRPGHGPVQPEAAGTAWRTKPSWYIVANNDRTVQPELERFVAKRMGAHTYDVDSSHVPMLSQPGLRPRRHPDRRELHLNRRPEVARRTSPCP